MASRRHRVATALALAAAVLAVRARAQGEADGTAAFPPLEAGAPAAAPSAVSPPAAAASAPAPAAASPPSGGAPAAPLGPDVTGEGRTLRPYVRPPMEENPPRTRADAGGVLPRDLPFRHDGIYLRAAMGIGVLYDRLRTDAYGFAFTRQDGRLGSATSFALGSELSVGGCITDGFVLGIGLFTLLAPYPAVEASGDGDWYELDLEQLALVAPHVDVYPWPSRGWHVQGAFGVAALTVGDAPTPDGVSRPLQHHVALGPGLMLAAGHEWWIGERWSFGGTVRWEHGWGAGTGFDGIRFSHRAGGLVGLVGFTLN